MYRILSIIADADMASHVPLFSRIREKKEQETVSDFLLGDAAGGGWYSALKVRVRLAR